MKGNRRHTSYTRPACPVEATLELIGGKWKGMVLFYLLDGKMRFSELKRAVGDVTQRMLTKQLRELEACGLINRIVYAQVPPKVEYELTKDGESLKPIIMSLKKWGETNADRLFDQRDAQTAEKED